MSAVNPTRAEDSACTREIQVAATCFRLLAAGTFGDPVIKSDFYRDLAGTVAALERVSRRVDRQNSTMVSVIQLLMYQAKDKPTRELLLDLIDPTITGDE